jgi:NTP pyrophosphatase (non-canonical NTP hydrolase)
VIESMNAVEELQKPLSEIEIAELFTAALSGLNKEGQMRLRRLAFRYYGGMTIADLIRESHATAVEKGWWEKDRSFGEGIALMHSELSEALEDWRRWGMDPSKFIIGPCFDEPAGDSAVVAGLAVELADVLIRIGDWCGRHGIPLEQALRAKMAYNKTRPHRHGGKLA